MVKMAELAETIAVLDELTRTIDPSADVKLLEQHFNQKLIIKAEVEKRERKLKDVIKGALLLSHSS
jgi:hypothetical protein